MFPFNFISRRATWILFSIAAISCVSILYVNKTWSPLFSLLLIVPASLLIAQYLAKPTIKSPASQALNIRSQALVVFIVGPYASKWFECPHSTGATRFDDKTVWMLAPTVDELKKKLSHLTSSYKETKAMAFFPFLPDGHESEALMISQIASWQQSFNSLIVEEPLPCVFGIYARLSAERYSHDPDRAVWIGKFNTRHTKKKDLREEFNVLLNKLERQDNGRDHHAVQRHAMVHSLISWFQETAILKSLQMLFCSSPLLLTGVIVADHGYGFVRHGAWSHWLAGKYEILPGLSASLSMPPVPAVPSTQVRAQGTGTQPRKQTPLWFWSSVVVALFLAISMIAAAWVESDRIRTVKTHLNDFNNIDYIYIEKKNRVMDILKEANKELLSCSYNFIAVLWRFSHCQSLRNEVAQEINRYKASPIYLSSGSVPLFFHGSSELNPGSRKILSKFLPILQNNRKTHFMIIGHSDNTGNNMLNLKLSERRAIAVRNWIIKNSDVPPENLLVNGLGDRNPIASNATEKGREKNRRVDIIPVPDNTEQLIKSEEKK